MDESASEVDACALLLLQKNTPHASAVTRTAATHALANHQERTRAGARECIGDEHQKVCNQLILCANEVSMR